MAIPFTYERAVRLAGVFALAGALLAGSAGALQAEPAKTKFNGVYVQKVDDRSTLVTTRSGESFYLGREYIVVKSEPDRQHALAEIDARIATLDAMEDDLQGADRAEAQRTKEDLQALRAELSTPTEFNQRDFNQRRYETRVRHADNIIEGSLRTAGHVAKTAVNTAGDIAEDATDTAGDIAKSAARTAGNVAKSIGRTISRIFD